MDGITSDIFCLLRSLGVTINYTGFFYTTYAVRLVVEEPWRLRLVTKQLYPLVAENYSTTTACVERNIRTIANVAWELNPGRLQELAHHDLPHKPTVSKFISILASGFLQEDSPYSSDISELQGYEQENTQKTPGIP